jgi:hypothetical protein
MRRSLLQCLRYLGVPSVELDPGRSFDQRRGGERGAGAAPSCVPVLLNRATFRRRKASAWVSLLRDSLESTNRSLGHLHWLHALAVFDAVAGVEDYFVAFRV